MEVRNVLIVGLGLLGGSLGMALKGKQYRRLGWSRREETRALALKMDAVDEIFATPEEALNEADLTILCLPVPVIPEFLQICRKFCKPGSVITDIGSVKGVIVDAARKALADSGIHFTGSHPMAGTEKSGLENAFATLYHNADGFITPGDSPEADDAVVEFWAAAGVRITRISPEDHDDLVAHTSHVLHIVASALALAILEGKSPEETALRFAGCATGFRDTSRIASSNPAMWREIVENNRMAVLNAMSGFDKWYAHFRELIQNGNFDEFEKVFAEGKRLRDSWTAYKENHKK
ncbi:MAG: prephenate dehydrogenase [Lentisphaeria bacterium]|nr:prephenate dehydrogenase [Lentisphaeria bacterium]